MTPLMRGRESQNSDRFSNCSNDCDSIPSSFHRHSLVRFANKPQVQTITNRDDYTGNEANACWYSCEEKSLMYKSYEKTVIRMEAGKRPKKNTTYRGLENFSEANSSQLDTIVHACMDTIMDEQDRQWEGDIFDWDQFREMSLEISQQSISLAYKMADYDEREARKAYIAMAKEEYERKQQEDLKSDDSSVSTEITEVTNSTMAQDIKSNHHKIQPVAPSQRLRVSSSSSSPPSSSSKKSKKKSKSHPPKARSSGSRKIGDALETLNSRVYNDKLRERECQPHVFRAK